MEKYLITGFSGFVSRYFLKYLDHTKITASVLGIDIHNPDFEIDDYQNLRCVFKKFDLLDKEGLKKILYRFQPKYILHLAAYSSVAYSWHNPVSSFQNNTNILLNLLETVRRLNMKVRILSIGSSEEYGIVSENQLPLLEEYPLNPISPYAVSRIS